MNSKLYSQASSDHSDLYSVQSLIDEWKILKEEVARKQDFGQRLILASVAGSFAVYSFALRDLNTLNAFVALLPIIVITFAYYWILKDSHSAIRITKYVREYIEPKVGLFWETWLQLLREEQISRYGKKTTKKRKFSIELVYDPIYYAFYGVSILICINIIWAQGSIGATYLTGILVDNRLLFIGAAILFAIVWYFTAGYFFRKRRQEIYRLIDSQQPTKKVELMSNYYDQLFQEIREQFSLKSNAENDSTTRQIEELQNEFHRLCKEMHICLEKLSTEDKITRET